MRQANQVAHSKLQSAPQVIRLTGVALATMMKHVSLWQAAHEQAEDFH